MVPAQGVLCAPVNIPVAHISYARAEYRVFYKVIKPSLQQPQSYGVFAGVHKSFYSVAQKLIHIFAHQHKNHRKNADHYSVNLTMASVNNQHCNNADSEFKGAEKQSSP